MALRGINKFVSKEINLLPETEFVEKAEEKSRQKSVFGISLAMTVVSAILIFGAFAYSLYLRNQDAAVLKKTDQEIKKISSAGDKVILLWWTKNNLSSIQQVLSSRPLYDTQLKSLDFITGLATTNASLADYSFSGKAVDFTVYAQDSVASEDFIKRLLDENKTDPVLKSVTVKSAELQKDGGYKLSFAATLN